MENNIGSAFLNVGITIASFSSLGTSPVSNDLLNIVTSGSINAVYVLLMTAEDAPFQPGLLLF